MPEIFEYYVSNIVWFVSQLCTICYLWIGASYVGLIVFLAVVFCVETHVSWRFGFCFPRDS